MQNARLHFSKTFDARYISHLDLARVFARAIKQSRLPVWYTEGFNAHLYITFALPLSLGYESICEVADLRFLDEDIDAFARERINACLPHGIEVFDIAQPVKKPSEIGWARYRIELGDEEFAAEAMAAALEELLARPVLETQKKSKKGGMVTLDIRPMIDEAAVDCQGGLCFLDLLAAAGSEKTLNPSLLLDLMTESLGRMPLHMLVKRVQILDKNRQNFE